LLKKKLNDTVQMFAYFSTVLDDGTDTSDTAHLLIFIRGVNSKFGVITELLSLEAMKVTTTDENLCVSLSATLQ